MKLYLVRHGDYLTNKLENIGSLSEKGKRDIQNLVGFLQPFNIHVSHLFHSGKLRAQQTAELLVSGIICEEKVAVRQGLNPLDDVSHVADDMVVLGKDVLLVGHLPFMSKLVAKLVTGDENKNVVVFQTSTIVCLEQIDNQYWVIHWMLNPDLLSSFNH